MGPGSSRTWVAVAAAVLLAGSVATTASSRVANPHDGGLQVKPQALNFGAVHAGDVKQRTLVVTNATDSPMPLSAAWFAGGTLSPGFGFPTGDSCLQTENEILAPGATCTLTFTFAPDGASDASATFVFTTDGWATTAATVSLRAKGL
jgi:Abnormal spindle-like microcephaly-assoc'd, ASPM-SPD-2-Hydin